MTTNEYTAHLAPASSQECRKCKTAVDLKEVHETTYKIVFTFTLSFVLSLLIKKKFLKKLRLENDSQFVHLKDYPLEAGNNRKTSIPTRNGPQVSNGKILCLRALLTHTNGLVQSLCKATVHCGKVWI